MTTSQDYELFATDHSWLCRQPGMSPWEDGCSHLESCLTRWAETYSQSLCDPQVTEQHESFPEYVAKLWTCWRHHWRDAISASTENAADGEEVAQRIQAGRGYRHGGSLQGDPLRDVVLALAFVLYENRAIQQFEAEYKDFAAALASRQNRRLGKDIDNWWNELLDFLGGFTKVPGKLHKYGGKSGLKHWLRPTVWNFIRRRPLPETYEVPETADESSGIEDDVIEKESYREFQEELRTELDQFSSDDFLLLYYLHVEGLKQNEVAELLGLAPGNITRRKQRILKTLQAIAEKHAAQDNAGAFVKAFLEAVKTCLADLRNGRPEGEKE